MDNYIQEFPFNDPKVAEQFIEIIRMVVQQEIKKFKFNRKYPATIVAVDNVNNVATIKLFDGEYEISNVKIRPGVVVNVGDICYVEAINGDLNNIYVDFNKTSNIGVSTHSHDDRYYTESEIDNKLNNKSDIWHTHTKSDITDFAHNHNDLYYTESEIDIKLLEKANLTHNHTKTDIIDFTHTHDDRYYTASEVDTKLSNKTDVGHTHSKLDIADFSHTHSISDINDLQTSLNNKVNTSEVVTTATPNKILKLNSNGKLPASITGDADTVDGLHASDLVQTSGDQTISGTKTFSGSVYARSLYVNPNGVPTSNLGNPTIAEMALFQEQFNNKLEFYDIGKFTFEYTTDGSTWITPTIQDVDKKKLVGGDSSSNISIPNGALQYRITIRNNGNYVYLNALYMYFSTNGHSMQVHIWKKRDDGDWVQHTSSTTSVSGWPGHLYLPFSTIPWSTQSTSGHYNEVRIVFIPTWSGSYPSNNINLYRLQLWGGYPAGKRTIYFVDYDKNVTFPASITATNQLISSVSTGTAPLSVNSTTKVNNLNADLLDDKHVSDLVQIGSNNQSINLIRALNQQIDTRNTVLSYDTNGRLTTVEEKDGATVVKTTTLNYDSNGNLTTVVEQVGGKTITTTLNYDSNDNLTGVSRSVV